MGQVTPDTDSCRRPQRPCLRTSDPALQRDSRRRTRPTGMEPQRVVLIPPSRRIAALRQRRPLGRVGWTCPTRPARLWRGTCARVTVTATARSGSGSPPVPTRPLRARGSRETHAAKYGHPASSPCSPPQDRARYRTDPGKVPEPKRSARKRHNLVQCASSWASALPVCCC